MPEKWYRASRVCAALGNPKNYSLLKLLAKEKMLSPTELSKKLNRSLKTISLHLRHLRSLDIVRYQKIGKRTVYWLKDARILKLMQEAERFIERTGFS